MTETWKDIEGFEGLYKISDEGHVYSVRCKKLLKLIPNQDGYFEVCLANNGKNVYRRVCRLVAIAFIPNPNNLPQVNHIDENKQNDKVYNLEWCSSKYNVNHGTAIKRSRQSYKSKSHKNWRKVICLNDGKVYASVTLCAKAYDGTPWGVHSICKGTRKTHRGKTFEFYDPDKHGVRDIQPF